MSNDTPKDNETLENDNKINRDGQFRQLTSETRFPFDALESITSKFKKTFILPFRMKEPLVYYHRQFPRVPTIDQCYVDDMVCHYEANEQFSRDRKVDSRKMHILADRLIQCKYYWGEGNSKEMCDKEYKTYKENQLNYFIKYGDIPRSGDAISVYMKQKHRMVWVRRMQEQGKDIDYRY